ncbi:MAG: beta-ketoacyl-[acyl-carrier-protein] synthase family protein [Actinobacteria bacterium]|nr:beta-ketoacyl-[acyl-carrier-protein] synthase family protein [Actinomycetota bacterium]HBQ51331.1 beta-ketoacyl synthase [Acidimicrobium sp.]NBQ03894.1 beta-ketoacyl-[acyl-carrier-protein] synthase family protein [Actinomycetota bacterium]NBY61483.1 beta-ketoacyl-[acyl-carrier-protein] synthase family protein [Actinomycetota bacterium]NDB27105.1 beta-ketoacyl-[acyl-carrier-protein] synthase family protein [Actinomycetota bacterium]
MQGAGHRVAITGYGVVAPCGIGKQNFWQGLLGKGVSGSHTVEIENWDPTPYFAGPKEARRADRCEQYALAAATEAIAQSGSLPYDATRIGTIFGTGIGGLRTLEEQVVVRVEKGERRVSPFLVPMMMSNASGAAISMRYGFRGPAETICTACAAATHALGYAARLVAWGRCDAVISGGAESAATITAVAGFANMTALSTSKVSKPFDATRDGFIFGEGAAVFVLERLDLALARNARIYGEILGAGSNADAHHITAPSPGGVGAIACMKLALDDAGLSPSAIKQVNAHGTSTPLNDAAEASAVAAVFGQSKPPMTSIKGVTGHPLGAAGALEAAAVLLSIEHKLIPPTANTTVVDPEMSGVDIVTGAARAWQPGPTISNNFGFGGHNGSIIIAP